MIVRIFSALLLLVVANSCGDQQPQQKWYKGNLHTHSYWSDGDEFPEMIMSWYRSHGYNFVALSDHNVLPKQEKWITLSPQPVYQRGFEKYLEKYGSDWVEYRNDTSGVTVKLKTLQEYEKLFEEEGSFLIMPAEEITDNFNNEPLHVNAINIADQIHPQGGKTITEVLQNNVDMVLKQRAETGIPMFPHINHPNFHYAISVEDIIALQGERFFEVYNGHPAVNNLGDSSHLGTEEIWDKVNVAYLKRNQSLLYGIATDDSHHYHRMGSEYSNAGRGWIMVQSDSLTPASLIKAMEQGDFYASTGVILEKLEFKQNTLDVMVRSEPGVKYTILFIGVRKDQLESEILSKRDGMQASFDLSKDLAFVRIKIVSDKKLSNPVVAEELETAWTQPVGYQ